MALQTNGAEAGTNGNSVVAGTSGGSGETAFTTRAIGAGSTLTYDNTNVAHGKLAFKFVLGAATFVTWSGLSATQIAVRFSVFFVTLPAAAIRLLDIRDISSTTILRVQLTAANTVQVQEGGTGTPISMTTAALSTGQWYRFEVVISTIAAGTGAYTADYYLGDSLTSQQGVAKATGGQLGTANIDSVNYGAFSGASGTFWMDDLANKAGVTAYLGPVPQITASGTSTVACVAKVARPATLTAHGVAAVTPATKVAHSASATASGVSVVAPVAKSARALTATSAGAATATPVAKVTRTANAAIHGVASFTGTAKAAWAARASIAGTASVAPVAGVTRPAIVTIHGQATAAPVAKATRAGSAAAHGVSTVASSGLIVKSLSAAIHGVATVAPVVKVARAASAAVHGAATAAGTLKAAWAARASAAGVAAVTGSLLRGIAAQVTGPATATVYNADMELAITGGTRWGTTGYFSVPITADTVTFHGGAQSATFTTADALHDYGFISGATPGAVASGSYPTPAGSVLRGSYWLKAPNGVSWQAAYRIESPANEILGQKTFTSTGSWQLVELITAVLAAAGTGIAIQMHQTSPAAGVTANFDDVSFTVYSPVTGGSTVTVVAKVARAGSVTAHGTSTCSASAKVARAAGAVAHGVATATPVVKAAWAARATATGQSGGSFNAKTARSAASAIHGTSTVTPSAKLNRPISAVAHGQAAVTLAYGTARALSAAAHGLSTAAPIAKVARAGSCVAHGVASFAANAKAAWAARATCTGAASFAATAKVARSASASSHGTGGVTPIAKVARTATLTVHGTSTFAPAYKTARSVTATVHGAASFSATAKAARSAKMTAHGQSGWIANTRRFSAGLFVSIHGQSGVTVGLIDKHPDTLNARASVLAGWRAAIQPGWSAKMSGRPWTARHRVR